MAGKEYCLLTFTGTIEATRDCVALPAGCSDCACAQDDAPKQFPTSNNCASGTLISCSRRNAEIKVECHR